MEYNYPKFTPEMKKTHTILIPNMAITQFRLLEYALRYDGYKCEILGNCGSAVAQLGLKYVHNDTCYPALLVIDQFLDALNSGKVAQYFCDFPTEELLGVKGVCCTPHLGASTPESETNCAVMAAAELSDYLKNGNIAHSVNLPDVSQPRVGGRRICIIHKNAPGAISAITSILTEAHLNIENMVNKGKKDVAYTLLDVTGNVTDDLAVKLGAIEPAIRVRVL